MQKLILLALVATVLAMTSGCAQRSDTGSSVTHRVHNQHLGCDFACQRMKDELIRRDIEDRIILEDALDPHDGAELY
ncbi:hypothetical protein [Shewanella waksmanii]|nr:hypothetical protein [Shewanella waksmanii]